MNEYVNFYSAQLEKTSRALLLLFSNPHLFLRRENHTEHLVSVGDMIISY